MGLTFLFDKFRYKPVAHEPASFFGDFLMWLNEELDYEVGYLNGKIAMDDLIDWDILFVFSPGENLPYSCEEVNVLSSWIENGGVLIITRPVKGYEKLDNLTERFGLKFTNEKANSYAFFAGVTDKLMEADPERFSKYKRILADHPINRGLKAVAEGPPKSNLRPFFIEVSNDWDVIGACLKNNEAKPVAAIRNYGKGLIIALGIIYLFYMWEFWFKNESLEKKEDTFISNVTFIRRIFNFIENYIKKLEKENTLTFSQASRKAFSKRC